MYAFVCFCVLYKLSNQLGWENRNEEILPAAVAAIVVAERNVKLDKWNKYNESAMHKHSVPAQMDGNEHEPQPELVASGYGRERVWTNCPM